jgi:large subunit ribosomal protein L13e
MQTTAASGPAVVSRSLSWRVHTTTQLAQHRTNNIAAAGIPRKFARTIGISVDPRRQNLSEEGLKANVERLQEFRKRLILFPRRNGKTKEGDASAEDIKSAKTAENIVRSAASVLPIKNTITFEEGKIADFKGEENAYRKLRDSRSEARYQGAREKRAKAKAEDAADKKK